MFAPEPDTKFTHVLINYIMIFISHVAYAVVCLLFYSKYEYVNCTESGVKLQDWLITSGIIYCFIPLIHFSIFGLKYKLFAFIYYFYSFALYLPFNIAWSILGSVILFQKSHTCLSDHQNLWILSLCTLIFQWINIFSIFWELYEKCKTIDLS